MKRLILKLVIELRFLLDAILAKLVIVNYEPKCEFYAIEVFGPEHILQFDEDELAFIEQ
jgi:hypothetical protein